MNRKAITTEGALVTIIIFLVVIGIIAVLYNALFAAGGKQFSVQECRSSLLLTRMVDYPQYCMVKMDNPIPVKCERNFLTVTDAKVTKAGKVLGTGEMGAYSPACPDGSNNCLVKSVMAEEMRNCWNEFYEGQTPVLQQAEGGSLVLSWKWDPNSKKRACFVCAEVAVKSASNVSDFKEYLKRTQMPSGQRYYDYFTSSTALCAPDIAKSSNCWEGVAVNAPGGHPKIDQNNISAGTTYAVVFMRHGIGPCEKSNQGGDAISQTVQFFPADQINQQCDAVIV